MQRSSKIPSATNFGSRKSPRAIAPKASSIRLKTFQQNQRPQRTMAGPNNSIFQNKPSNRSSVHFNTVDLHNDDQRKVIEIMQHEASLVGTNAVMDEKLTRWLSLQLPPTFIFKNNTLSNQRLSSAIHQFLLTR